MQLSSIRAQAIRAYQLDQILRRHPEIVDARIAASGIRDELDLSPDARIQLAARAPHQALPRNSSPPGFLSLVKRFTQSVNVTIRRMLRGNARVPVRDAPRGIDLWA